MNQVKKRTVKPDGRARTEARLKEAGFDVTLDWDNCFEEKQNTRVPIKCNKHGTTITRNVADLKLGKYQCEDCVLETRTKAVKKRGFSLVNKISDKSFLLSCDTCGESKITSVSHLYQHSGIYCETCHVNKYKKVLEDNNCKYISHHKSKTGVTTFTYYNQNGIRRQNVASDLLRIKFNSHVKQQLSSDDYKRIVESKGFDFINVPSPAHIRVKCREDGSERDVTRSVVRNGEIVCYECRHRRVVSELLKRDCLFVKYLKVKYEGNRVIYSNSSGELFDTFVCSVQQGKFATTKEGHWFTNHSVYLIKLTHNGQDYCKIGTAINPINRARHLKLLGAVVVYTLASFEHRKPADNLEKQLHKEFKEYKLDPLIPETFTLRTINRKRAGSVERVSLKDGIHEWFTSDVLPILASRYNLIKEEETNGIDSNSTDQVSYSG